MPVYKIGDKEPQIDNNTYIAPTAVVAGDVIIKEGASVWFYAVARGDCGWPITIGRNTNVQDHVMIHTDYDWPTEIGDSVTIGHGAIIHGAKIGDNCLIGMGAVLLDRSVIGEHSVVGANTLVPPGKEFPAYSLILGNPGKVVKTFTPEEVEPFKRNAQSYVKLWQQDYKGKVK
ncbi:gamma carbonic anhydrase family protein [Heliorestis acidaminivorans]|uniref:Gamma carbonic anhydrase family protein n=1 Tax=Heliorestis acidaminivorans TaxID=553427 RepID=A0A6I0EZA0_9FIRM|nr:gamma carbonic anhydrase family protein [Heliorestis acidaminivorans]KAB2952269.1 gamma carbonic anhydrase family protein [Heliorestis acidaminivorans]